MSELGAGLTSAQQANFAFFKTEWDKKCMAEFNAEWPTKFLEMLQGVINDIDLGNETAFSQFVFDQERKYFAGQLALAIPPPRRIITALADAHRTSG